MAYAIGHISGCHLNPAVTVGLAVGGRFSFAELPVYIIAQTIGAIAAAFLLLMILQGHPGFTLSASSLAVNGFGDLSPGKYTMMAALITEVVMTAMFLFIILGATDKRGITSHGGLAIGLGLTLIHLISIPVTNTSVNPARSTGPALVLFLNGQARGPGSGLAVLGRPHRRRHHRRHHLRDHGRRPQGLILLLATRGGCSGGPRGFFCVGSRGLGRRRCRPYLRPPAPFRKGGPGRIDGSDQDQIVPVDQFLFLLDSPGSPRSGCWAGP